MYIGISTYQLSFPIQRKQLDVITKELKTKENKYETRTCAFSCGRHISVCRKEENVMR